MGKTFLNADRFFWRASPFKCCGFFFATSGKRASHFNHALCGIRAAVQHHIFNTFTQRFRQIVVNANHACIDNAHGHPSFDRMVEEHSMNRLARWFVATEAKAHIGDTARDFSVR